MTQSGDGVKITSRQLGDGSVLKVEGEVDLRTSPLLRNAAVEILAQRPARLIIDLTEVAYMDSSGVGTMVYLKREIERNGGKIILSGLQTRVRGVFEITQLDKFFTITQSVDEAAKK